MTEKQTLERPTAVDQCPHDHGAACGHDHGHAHEHEHVHGEQCTHAGHDHTKAPAPLLSITEIQARLKSMPGWELDKTHLVRSFHFPQPEQAAAYVSYIIDVAERRNHHPHVHWWKRDVRIELWTHKSNGLTHFDFDFASSCEPLCEVAA